MRTTSALFVSALLRRVNSGGGYAAILRRGNAEAGAVFLVLRRRDGSMAVYGPAPQLAYGGDAGERCFSLIADPVDPAALDRLMERELRFDSDLWLVELEPAESRLEPYVSLSGPA